MYVWNFLQKNWINIYQVIIKMGENRNPAIAATSYLAADASKKKDKRIITDWLYDVF